jgi:hypothetical protein
VRVPRLIDDAGSDKHPAVFDVAVIAQARQRTAILKDLGLCPDRVFKTGKQAIGR